MTCTALAQIAGAMAVTVFGDYVVLAPTGPSELTLCYYNGESVRPYHELEVNGIKVKVSLDIDGDGPETITVTPPDGWAVYPADDETKPVADGEEITVKIISGIS